MTVKVVAKENTQFLEKGKVYYLAPIIQDNFLSGRMYTGVTVGVSEDAFGLFCIYDEEELNRLFKLY